MLALRKLTPAFGLNLQEVSEPSQPRADELRVRVSAAGVCGSDVHAYEWTDGYGFMTPLLPITLGHEFAGHVEAVGSEVSGYAVGDPVTAWPTVVCGACAACRAGRPQHCPNRQIIGLHRNGGFASHVTVPAANAFRLPEGLDPAVAALAEPLTIAFNALDVGGVGEGDAVVVLGAGPIGLGIAWLAQHRGARPVILAGFEDPLRLRCAGEMGIEHRVDIADEPLEEAVRRVAGGPVDCVIEATGKVQSIDDALRILRAGGIAVAAGIHDRKLTVDLTRLIREKQQIRGAHDSTREAWRAVLAILAEQGGSLGRMVTHRLPLAEGLAGFELARRREAVKVLLEPGA
ncbi:zinc-dependent alcohol dehydrogenase [Marinivivus vitaminiproducens]|uniref:zinc-dependent alcohol dehydrogenase n=1 Tax=Marinivivus vitaminiproducens TaxID=3035935 RepID=UPI0027A60D88|nr:alcohol dehydrogenase catalytic domain-containing protein [Geminicoccaceae bacterium SCSIO 64248]